MIDIWGVSCWAGVEDKLGITNLERIAIAQTYRLRDSHAIDKGTVCTA